MGRPEDDAMPMSDRLVTAAEMAQIMGVAESDVREWIADGRLPSEPGEDGSPRFRITEGHLRDGPVEEGLMFYSTGAAPDFAEEQARRQRAHERSQGDPGGVDLGLLTEAVAARLRRVAPHRATVTVEDVGFIRIGDRLGGWAGIGLTPANLDGTVGVTEPEAVLELDPLRIADVLLGAAGEDARPRKRKAKGEAKGKGKAARGRGRP
jgi:hypothetical protein